ncbi:MAG: exopolysaccharide biosynthesis polyprenyl glycosylphosphotransferase [Pseudomonadota bacterium]
MSVDHSKGRTLILGAGNFATLLAREILAQPQSGYQLLGLVNCETHAALCGDLTILGQVENLHSIIVQSQAERIIVALPRSADLLPTHHLIEARVGTDILVEDGDTIYEELTGKLRIEALEPRLVIFDKALKPSHFSQGVARALSFCCAVVGMIVFTPLLLLLAFAVKLDSDGPALFIQERVGLGGKPFRLLKFRTMRPSDNRKSEWVSDNTHRITRLGRILRKYRLDELPQFINVLKGDMNIVGPRPHPASNLSMFVLVSRNTPECGFQIPYYTLRSLVRPGITGWAQVRYRYANNLREEIEKLRFDLYYVKHYSLWLDIRILVETIAVVFLGRESSETSDHDDKDVAAETNSSM